LPHSRDKLVVTDAGPLMALGRIDQLGLLQALFAQVHVPQQVIDECLIHPDLPDAIHINAAISNGWLMVAECAPLDIRGLDLGERCAIGCALDLRATLLVDDRAARRHAETLGLTILGTLGLLVLAKRRGLIPLAKPLMRAVRDGGHHISRDAMAAALRAANESPE
jgi:uncharacterized protein